MTYQLMRITAALTKGFERPQDGSVPWSRLIAGYALPTLCGVGTFTWASSLKPGALLPAAAIISGVLLSLSTMSYNRVKDLSGDHDWDGIDPMSAAVEFARASVRAAQISIATSSLLVVGLLIPDQSTYAHAVVAASCAVLLHLFVRIWYLLVMIRHQVGATAGQRATRPVRH